jgi:hypothetical protein
MPADRPGNQRSTDRPLLASERYWVSILDEHKRIVNGGSGWMLRSPEVTRSRVFDYSARAEVEVTGASGTVLVFDMSKEDDSWLVKDFDDTWGNTGP